MPENLYLDYYSVGIPVIFIAIGIILYLQSLLKKRLGAETIAKCHEVGSYYLSMVGTFYAVLLGLIVVDAMTKFQEAQSAVDREMTALIRIYSSAERFPEQRAHLEKTVTDYADEVIDVEFPMMERKGRPDEKARDIALEILQTVKGIEPVTENQKAMFPILLSDVSDLLIARRERTKATNFGEPTVEWIILVTGGLITIILTFFFTIESHAIHMFMRIAVALTILMSLYLTFLFGSPFSGDLKVSSEPLKMVDSFAKWSARMTSKAEPKPTACSSAEQRNEKEPQMEKRRAIKK
jgi:hypothetical protein